MARSKSYNQHEATIATKQAQKLLRRYNLTLSEVEAKEIIFIDQSLESQEVLPDWLLIIMKGIETAFKVRVLVMTLTPNKKDRTPDKNAKPIKRFLRHVGRALDVEVSKYTLQLLMETIERLWRASCKEEEKEKIIKQAGNTWMNASTGTAFYRYSDLSDLSFLDPDEDSYKLGVAQSIAEKLFQMKSKEAEQFVRTSPNVKRKNNIITIKSRALERYMSEVKVEGEIGNKAPTIKDPYAFSKGEEDGKGVQIRKGIN